MKIVPGVSIKHLRKLDDDQLPDGCIKKTLELECWLGNLLRGVPQSTKQQVSERYFLKNLTYDVNIFSVILINIPLMLFYLFLLLLQV